MPCMFVNDTCEVSRNYFIPRAAIQAEDPSLPIFVQRELMIMISRYFYWASVSEPHTSVFYGEFVCAYGVRACVRTYVRMYALPHIVSRFNITFQIVSVIFQIVHVATVAAVQLA